MRHIRNYKITAGGVRRRCLRIPYECNGAILTLLIIQENGNWRLKTDGEDFTTVFEGDATR